MINNIHSFYFSATGTTKRVVDTLANDLAARLTPGEPVHTLNFTSLPVRQADAPYYSDDDLVVCGIPVYAGRVPNVLLKYLRTVSADNATAVAVVLYGNRNYDDGLIELRDILTEQGFKVIAAAAFVGEHAFSYELAAGRPDLDDLRIAHDFAEQIIAKLDAADCYAPLAVNGEQPYRAYYKPKDEKGEPVDIRKITPLTNDKCNNCGVCVKVCPMSSISAEDVRQLIGICIKCGACVKCCPQQAKYFDALDFNRHKTELERQFKARRPVELFI